MEHRMEQEDHGGMQCDNPDCDWQEPNLHWKDVAVGTPCPKCGQSILTEEDKQFAEELSAAILTFDTITEEEVKALGEKMNNAPETLTDEDFKKLNELITILGPLTDDMPEEVNEGTMVSFTAGCHKGISISNVKFHPKTDEDESGS